MSEQHPAVEMIEAIVEDRCRDSVYLVLSYYGDQLSLTDWYSLEGPEIPPCSVSALALWAMAALAAKAAA